MSNSGVPLNPECLTAYNELKLGHTYKYIIFKLNDKLTEIVVDEKSTDGDYDSFIEKLPVNEPRWVVYDFEYEKPGGEGKRNKLLFYSWAPDDAKIRQKMVYASSKDTLRKTLVGIGADIQGSDFSDVEYATVLEKVDRVQR